jgi:4-hydroxythreonine-4-phosphate dehydrogenase
VSGPHVAVTLGDPRGIGPEVALQAIAAFAGEASATIVVVTPAGTFEPSEAARAVADYTLPRDAGDTEAGAASVESIERAVEGALAGRFQAIVTGPVHKPSLHAAGWHVPGQTEMLGRLTAAERVGMLMAAERTRLGGPLRVLLATTHLPSATCRTRSTSASSSSRRSCWTGRSERTGGSSAPGSRSAR